MARNFTEACKSVGISPSITRKMIYEYIEEANTHPTADEIYRSLIDALPTLSKTTVYNVVNLFLEKNLLIAINTSNNEKRYELMHDSHSHFICKNCNKIYDIPKISTSYNADSIPDFRIDNEEVNLYGLCTECMKK